MHTDSLYRMICSIAEQLSRNARARGQLQTLLKVAVQAREDAEQTSRDQSTAPQTERISRSRSRKGGGRP
jgi:hypothetical protein